LEEPPERLQLHIEEVRLGHGSGELRE
jgi:hypothetical protein